MVGAQPQHRLVGGAERVIHGEAGAERPLRLAARATSPASRWRIWAEDAPPLAGELSAKLTEGAFSAGAQIFPKHQARIDFWACSRFSASSQIRLAGPSITSSVTSSPRWAGRQCRKTAFGAAS